MQAKNRAAPEFARFPLSLALAGMVFFLWGERAFAETPECATLTGNWLDEDGYQNQTGYEWQLNQDSDGNVNGQVTLNVTSYGCPIGSTWSVNVPARSTVLTAIGAPYNAPACPGTIARSVRVGLPGSGCDTASTSWNGGAGYWVRTARQLPSGEGTPKLAGWKGAAGLWNTAVLPLSFNFGGRRVQEAIWKPGTDTCWFSGSALDQFTQVTGGTWDVANDGTNVYGPDGIGPGDKAVYYYRLHNKAPCGSTIYQAMLISCDGPWNTCLPAYINNTLSFTIAPTTVTSVRAGASEMETYSLSQSKLAAIKFIIALGCWSFAPCRP